MRKKLRKVRKNSSMVIFYKEQGCSCCNGQQ